MFSLLVFCYELSELRKVFYKTTFKRVERFRVFPEKTKTKYMSWLQAIHRLLKYE